MAWGFKPQGERVYAAAPFCTPHLYYNDTHRTAKFFQRLEVLTDLHLLAPVTYLVDSATEDGEEMWPIAIDGAGEECELDAGGQQRS
jgi:hypothetical protein